MGPAAWPALQDGGVPKHIGRFHTSVATSQRIRRQIQVADANQFIKLTRTDVKNVQIVQRTTAIATAEQDDLVSPDHSGGMSYTQQSIDDILSGSACEAIWSEM